MVKCPGAECEGSGKGVCKGLQWDSGLLPRWGCGGRAVEWFTAGGWVWLGEEKEEAGAGETRDRWAVRASPPSPVLRQAYETLCVTWHLLWGAGELSHDAI